MIRHLVLLAAILLVPAVASAAPLAAGEGPAQGRIAELTLQEKASLVTGYNASRTRELPRLEIPSIWLVDGPVGLRKKDAANPGETVPATCFPSAAAMAATWNPRLVERVGAAIGREARSHDVTLLLAPGMNIKRHPLGGRNFEYYSEDPRLSGRMAAAFVRGVQSEGVGATIKHYAVNNQEYRRMSIDARVTERALREIYLRGFEIALAGSSPQAAMSAYNRVNGTPVSESTRLLQEILRGEWGFSGLVVSDWGAVNDPVAALAAGLDLEMPGNRFSPPRVVEAVNEGRLDEAVLDRAVGRVLALADRRAAMSTRTGSVDLQSHHDLAREVALESMVLLDNDGFLPLENGAGTALGMIGRLVTSPRIQGIGSSQVHAARIDDPLPALAKAASAAGFDASHWGDGYAESGLDTDEKAALTRYVEQQDRLIVFAGQRASQDSEAADRSSIDLAPAELEILDIVKASGKPFGVVLVGGASIDVRPLSSARAVLMSWLGGQAWGRAVAAVLFGEANPSGKLSETFAWSVLDHASALNFPGGPDAVHYGEGLYVGYRYFTTFDRDVAYPFGHGLSYTTFDYTDSSAPTTLTEIAAFEVSVVVRNSGERTGAETVQVYARHLDPSVRRPDRELIAFEKVEIAPGRSARVSIPLHVEDLAFFSTVHDQWVVEPGRYELLVGSSSTDIRRTLPLELEVGTVPARIFTVDDVFGDIYGDPQGRVVTEFLLQQFGKGASIEAATEDDHFEAVLRNLPFRKLKNFSKGRIGDAVAARLLALVNSDLPPEEVGARLRELMNTK